MSVGGEKSRTMFFCSGDNSLKMAAAKIRSFVGPCSGSSMILRKLR